VVVAAVTLLVMVLEILEILEDLVVVVPETSLVTLVGAQEIHHQYHHLKEILVEQVPEIQTILALEEVQVLLGMLEIQEVPPHQEQEQEHHIQLLE
jgi:hypothetical protein